jgi:hypothetical protein
VDVTTGQAADQRQEAKLARGAELLSIAIEAVGKEEDGLIGLVAEGELRQARGRIPAGLSIAGEPMRLGLKVTAEKGEGHGMCLRAGVGERGGSAEADKGCIAQEADDASNDVAGGILVRCDQDAQARSTNAPAWAGVDTVRLRAIQGGAITGACSVMSGFLQGHRV